MDLGYDLSSKAIQEKLKSDISSIQESELTIDYNEGMALFRAGRPLQRNARLYWLYEYIRKLMIQNPNQEVAFECVVLGCIDSDRDLYAIYVHELGLEHKYLSEIGSLLPGHSFWLKVKSVNPRTGVLSFSIASADAKQQNRFAAKAA